ncbi:Actin-related protein 2/3 complex subunit 3 [Komagataella phaffii CBS 7435]|uniref:Actin-related protein 2/3 complex subunit 3 n=2 Tax=Komagataella phaffii TaxID=460519 RepID=C4R3Y8_KOMPG|nr:Subunit of the ARP2/3 complex [Komagataella phaffii GS115]KAI0464044.1 subunit of the Arp2/3 complex [Komagataella kurtzmanii]CAH2449984.1 Actin-related protein 2/3 complex subunit 3 [Komagataella phaffii CBS 7435]AOA69358.1 GQ68_03258T0 [Komagataella phaffii GS115]CAY70263.1 Subunit of the ARP2/3 complex [Komagataella phaffii GS115]CCA39931.1 Actin-related protein 2/3 complex subunit 3 [Komagataella phaffii CBS 7435]
MPAYHSTFLNESSDFRVVGNTSILPIKTKFRGPAYPSNSDYDIIDECLDLFRANSFFKNFEIKGPADRLLIYGILFISSCLQQLKSNTTKNEAVRILSNLSLDDFSIPGDVGFPLNSLYQPPRDKTEADLLRGYVQQFRQELATRLIERLYSESDSKPSKYWLAFTRRRFMNKSL